MKPILAFDTACTGASIALRVGGHTHTRRLEQSQQAAELVCAIDALLREQAVAYRDLGCIVSTVGPGSFTGVRIGLAALHGFVLVNPTPIKLLSTLGAMAWQAVQATDAPASFYISLRAGKGEVYAQRFTIKDKAPIAAGDIFLAPEGRTDWDAPCFGNDANSPIAGPDAGLLCSIADRLPESSLADAAPLYIRPPDAIAPAPLSWLAAN